MRKSAYLKLLFSGGLVLLLAAFLLSLFSARSLEQISEKCATEADARYRQFLSIEDSSSASQLRDLYRRRQMGLYDFKGDSLVGWNNARMAFTSDIRSLKGESGFAKLSHGYYFYAWKNRTGGTRRLLLLLVLPQYDLQNNYLENTFPAWTGIPAGIRLSADTTAVPVMLAGRTQFGIVGQEQVYHEQFYDVFSSVLFLCSLVLLFGAAIHYLRKNNRPAVFYGISGIALLARVLMLVAEGPEFLRRTMLYDVSIFGNAASWLNGYLGDILLNTLFLMFLSAVMVVHFRDRRSLPALILQSAFVVYLSVSFVLLASSLVSNSTINFDFLNVLNLRLPAIIAVAVLCGYGLAIFTCMQGFLSQVPGSFLRAALYVALLALLTAFALFMTGANALEYIWPFPLFLLFFLLQRGVSASLPLSLAVQVLVMSLLSSRLLATHIEQNYRQELNLLSYKLSERQDPVLESEFSMLPARILADENLHNLFDILPAAGEAVNELLRQKYFSGYFDRYNTELQLFDKNCQPQLPVEDGLLNNLGYFEDEISQRSDSVSGENLFFVKGYQRNTRYIAKINFENYKLYILLDAKKYEELGTLPDLMLDRSQQKQDKLRNVSHAVYRAGQLASHYGELNYPFFLSDSSSLSASHPGFISRFFEPEENAVIVISERARTVKHFFTVNSYMLLFFSLFSFVIYTLYSAVFSGHTSPPSLTRRIQTVVIMLLLVSMSAIGYTSARLVTSQFEADNRRTLEEKTEVVLAELTSGFSRQQIFDETRKELVNLRLREFSRLFGTPISLFDSKGKLSNTSEPKLYELGLAAPLANPYALEQLSANRSGVEAVNEKAGNLTYLSLYTPVFSDSRQLLGFVNLPYFARQSELVNELSGIISALVNVYVLLFVLSILAGLLLSGYITRPLRLIQQQIAKVSLGGSNEKISWKSNDEIGNLVAAYNDMLLKLEDSALLLAQSERESAWREMARQVAHEIKNPLTPMKLSLQYLQHVMKSNPADFRDKFDRSAPAIIEQIDSLANIATEFSNFARLPSASMEQVNLAEVISSSLLLFGDDNRVKVLNHTSGQELMVKGDREQCLRVFNNLLKNAVQAMEDVQEPGIEISARVDAEHVVVSVKDNGCGIPAGLRAKLFTPNFTTKSTGSGLGLAMVRNIMEGFGGRIWYVSEEGKGAEFYLEFDLVTTGNTTPAAT